MALGFPGFANLNRMTIRAPVNPQDKCTLVNIYPREIALEVKPTCQPGRFQIPTGTYDKPGILIVEPSSYWIEKDVDQHLVEIPIPSTTMADSIIRDFCNGLIACDMSNAMPGMFFVLGKWTRDDIKRDHKIELDMAKTRQDNWYKALIRQADILWARTNGNPLAVGDDIRFAAKELGEERPWMKDFEKVGLIRCIACGNLRDPRFPICSVCKAIADPEMASKLNLTFAQ